ncbi:IS21 family transposase, partial [Thiolapillus sp.]
METIAKIRRRHEVNGESISEIARRFNLSRNTVRKYLNQSDPQRYQRRQQPKPQLGAYEDQLKTWLEQDSQRPKKQRRTARRLFEDLQGAGYTGAYDSVQRFVKRWKQARPALTKAFVPLVFPAGDAAQFDWSHEQVELGGVVQTIKLTHFRLAHSRQPFLVAYFRESLEMVLDAHDRAFTFWGGIPQRMIYDNPRTLVDAVKVGKARRFNRQFLALANHYLFEPVACTPASG